MVHVKYTYKDGKRYGPYYYKTERVNGKIITTYLGHSVDDKRKRTFILPLIIGVLLLVGIVGALVVGYQSSLTGNVALDTTGTYFPGETLQGFLTITFQEGELVPATSLISARLGDVEKSFSLHELLSASDIDSLEGSFYAVDSSLTGSGTGYGLAGTQTVFPEVTFELELVETASDDSSASVESEDSGQPEDDGTSEGSEGQEQSSEESNSEGDSGEDQNQETPPSDESQEPESSGDEGSSEGDGSNSEESGDAGSSDSGSDGGNSGDDGSSDSGSSDGGSITGGVITGFAVDGERISGSASREAPFEYEVQEGYEVRLVSGSVQTAAGEVVSDDSVLIEQDGAEVRVLSSYEETISGFGSDYQGDQVYSLQIPLSLFEIIVQNETHFEVELTFGDSILFQEESVLELVELPAEENVTAPLEPLNQTLDNSTLANTTLVFVGEVPSVRLDENGSAILDVSPYFVGALSYDLDLNGVPFSVEGSMVTINAGPSFSGVRVARVIAEADGNQVLSNEFTIVSATTEFSLTTTRTKIVLGQPVRWTTNVTVRDGSSVVLQLPLEAENVTVTVLDAAAEVVSVENVSLSPLTGQVTGRLASRPSFSSWIGGFFGSTGRVSGEIDQGEIPEIVEGDRSSESIDSTSSEPETSEENASRDESSPADPTVVSPDKTDSKPGELLLDAAATQYVVDYYTAPPAAVEIPHRRGKTVTLEASESLAYTDVIVVTNLSNDLRIADPTRIQLYWTTPDLTLTQGDLKLQGEVPEESLVEEERHSLDFSEPLVPEQASSDNSSVFSEDFSQDNSSLQETTSSDGASLITGNAIDDGQEDNFEEYVEEENDGWEEVIPSSDSSDPLNIVKGRTTVPFEATDSDGDGFIDAIAWVVPHFSNQTYEIIVITKADHLNESREFVSDIYDSVKSLDGNWSEPIPDLHYVRVTFERNLSSRNDITIYPRIIEGNPQVEVYEKDQNVSLALFGNISEESYNTIYLSNLSTTTTQDVFDLRVIGGTLAFDHIIDPTLVIAGNISDIALVALNNETVAVVYANESTGSTVMFRVFNITGQTFSSAVVVDPQPFSTHFSNRSRVGAAPVNETMFWIGFTNITNADDVRVAYSPTGAVLVAKATGDAAIGTKSHDIKLTTMGDDRLIYCYIDQAEDDLDVRTYNLTSGALIGTEGDLNAAIVAADNSTNKIDCAAMNSSVGLAFGYDGGADDDATFHFFNWNSSEIVTDTDIDTSVGDNGQVTVASMDRNRTAMFWFNTTYMLRMAIRGVDNSAILAATNLFPLQTATDSFSDVRLAAATVKNLSSGKDNVVIVFKNMTAASRGAIQAAAYNGSGTQVTAPFTIDSSPAPMTMFAALGEHDSANKGICPGTFIVAYENDTGSLLVKSYWLNGTAWNGACNRDIVAPNVSFADPTPGNATSYLGSALPVNVTTTDGDLHYTFLDINRDVEFWHTFDHTNVTSSVVNTTDRSTWSRNATFVTSGGIVQNFTNFKWGTGLTINGSSGAYLNLPVGNYANITEKNFSLSFWMNAFELDSFGGVYATANCQPPYFALAMHSSSPKQFSIAVSNATTSLQAVASTELVPAQWYHIVAAGWDNGTNTNVTLYVNGVVNLSSQLGVIGGKYNNSVPNIGRYQCWGSFNGTLDDMILFSRTLSAAEVRALYNSTQYPYYYNHTPLSAAQYNITAYATDASGNSNYTETRIINLTASAADPFTLTACGDLTASGVYTLGATISPTSGSTCLNVTTQNVTIIGAGYSINSSAFNNSAIFSDQINTTLIGLNISTSNRSTALILIRANNSLISNVTITRSSIALSISDLSNITVRDVATRNQFDDLEALTAGFQASNVRDSLFVGVSTYYLRGGSGGTGSSAFGFSGTNLNGVSLVNSTFSTTAATADFDAAGVYMSAGTNITLFNVTVTNTTAPGSVGYGFYFVSVNYSTLYSSFFSDNAYNAYLEGYHTTFANSTLNATGFISLGIGGGPAGTNSRNISLVNLTFTNSTTRTRDLALGLGLHDIFLVDIGHIQNYTFTNPGSNVTFRSTNVGEVTFTTPINGSGGNLTADVRILNNSVFVNSSQSGLNRSANITLYNIPTNLPTPVILRDGVECSATICQNLSSLFTSTVRFNVTGWSNHSIGSKDSVLPVLNFTTPTPANGSAHVDGTVINVSVSSSDNSGNHYVVTDFNREVILWLRMDDINSTGAALDASTWSYNATVEGDTHRNASGRFGYGFYFDGNTGSADRLAVDLLNGNNSVFNGSFSISAWVYPRNATNSIMDIVGIEGAVSSNPGFNLRMLAAGNARFIVGNVTTSATADTSYSLLQDQWYHLVGIYNSTGGTPRILLYVNGTLADNSTAPYRCCSGPRQLSIGKIDNNGRIFNGTIDDVIIFNRTLTGQEVLALYNATANQYSRNFTGLSAGQYNFTSYAVDSSGNVNSTEKRQVTLVSTTVLNCQVLDQPNTVYLLGQSIVPSGTGPCINITAANVTFDGQRSKGYSIENFTFNYSAVYSFGQPNVSVISLNASVNETGSSSRTVWLQRSNNSFVFDSYLGRGAMGLALSNSHGVRVQNVTISLGATNGISLSTAENITFTDVNVRASGPVDFSGVNNVTLRLVNITGSTGIGLSIDSSGDTHVFNSWVSLSASHGIYSGGFNARPRFENSSFEGNVHSGFYCFQAANVTLVSVTSRNNSRDGIQFDDCYQSSVSNATLSGNGRNALRIDDAIIGPHSNKFSDIWINSTGSNAIRVDSSASNTNFTNVTVAQTASGTYGVIFTSGSANNIRIENGNLLSYNFTGNGNNVTFINTSVAELKFYRAINGSGNFSDIVLLNNSAFVNGSQPGLNRSANVTLYGVPTNLFSPSVLRDGTPCTDCYNFTALTAGTVVFNVTSWSNYSIGSGTQLTSCGNLTQAGSTYTLLASLWSNATCFYVSANNISLNMNGYTITGPGTNLSAVGVYIVPGLNNTLVRSGNFVNFTYGVHADGANVNVTLRALNFTGVYNFTTVGVVVQHITIDASSRDVIIREILVNGSRYGSGIKSGATRGVSFANVYDSEISNSTFRYIYGQDGSDTDDGGFAVGVSLSSVANVTLSNITVLSLEGGSNAGSPSQTTGSAGAAYGITGSGANVTIINSNVSYITGGSSTAGDESSNGGDGTAYSLSLSGPTNLLENLSAYSTIGGTSDFALPGNGNGFVITGSSNVTSRYLFASSLQTYGVFSQIVTNLSFEHIRVQAGGTYGFYYSYANAIFARNVTTSGFTSAGASIFNTNHSTLVDFSSSGDTRGIYLVQPFTNDTFVNITVQGSTGTGAIDFSGGTPSKTHAVFRNVTLIDSGSYAVPLSAVGNIEIYNLTTNGSGRSLSVAAFYVTSSTNITLDGFNSTRDYQALLFVGSSQNNSVSRATINASRTSGIAFSGSSVVNTTLAYINVINGNATSRDLNISTQANYTHLINVQLSNYSFGSGGSFIRFVNTSFGEITFLNLTNGSGTNLNTDIVILNNSVFVNSTQVGLNKSANVTFYGVPVNFVNPTILRDGVACSAPTCNNFTSFIAGTVIFNVSSWSNYSIGPSDGILPHVNFTTPTLANGSSVTGDSIYVNVTSSDNSGNHFVLTDFSHDLLLWYRMDDINASGDPLDSSWHKSNGSAKSGAVQNVTGAYGKSFSFDGQDDNIVVGDVASLRFTNNSNFSISAWSYRKTNTTAVQSLFDKFASQGYRLYYNIDGRLAFQIRNQTSSIFTVGGGTRAAVPNNVWAHTVLTFTGTNISLYINGTNVASDVPTLQLMNNTLAAYIGYAPNNLIYFNGSIDEVMVFNRTLTPTEVNALYNATRTSYARNFTNLGSGQYNFTSYAVDSSGNVNSTENRTVILSAGDTTAPGVTLNAPEARVYVYSESPLFVNVTLSETGQTVLYSLTSGLVNYTMSSTDGLNFNATNTSIASSSYTINIYANDTSGNRNDTITRTFTLDMESIHTCYTLDRTNVVFGMNQSITTTNSPCINVTRNNITLDGRNFNLTHSSGGATTGINASGVDTIRILNLSVNGFATTVDTRSISSTLNAGNVTVINSSVTSLNVRGYTNYSSGGQNGTGTDGGYVILRNSTLSPGANVSLHGGNATGQSGMPGDGGSFEIHDSFVNLSLRTVNFTNGVGVGLALTSYPSVFVINFSSGFEMINTRLGFNELARLLVANISTGQVIWGGYNDGEIDTPVSVPANLSNHLSIGSNVAYLNATGASSLNQLANITLYGVPTTFVSPAILRDGVPCSAAICANITSLTAGTVVFNVTSWSNYSIGPSDGILPVINFTSPTIANGSSVIADSIYANVTSSDNLGHHYVATDFNKDLLLWLRMDDINASGDPLDTSSYKTNGSAKLGAVQNISGMYGKSFTFDGIDSYVSVGDVPSLELANSSFTISLWVYTLNTSTKNVIGKIQTSGFNGWNLRLAGSNSVLFNTGNISSEDSLVATSIPLATWTHVVATYNSTTKVVYINGTQNASRSVINAVDNSSIPLELGRYPNLAAQFFNGSIDDVLIFNRSLSAAEVASLYNASVGQYYNNFSGLSTGQYNFTSYAVDRSGNVNSTEKRQITLLSAQLISCTNLTSSGQVYTLAASIWSNATCFYVSANNITLNMNGYTLTGPGTNVSAYGVQIMPLVNGTTVSGGTIVNFTLGVYANGSNTNLLIRSLNFSGKYNFSGSLESVAAVRLNTGAANVTLTDIFVNGSTFYLHEGKSGAYGLYLTSSSNVLIANSTFRNLSGENAPSGAQGGDAAAVVCTSCSNLTVSNITARLVTGGPNLHVEADSNGGGAYGLYLGSPVSLSISESNFSSFAGGATSADDGFGGEAIALYAVGGSGTHVFENISASTITGGDGPLNPGAGYGMSLTLSNLTVRGSRFVSAETGVSLSGGSNISFANTDIRSSNSYAFSLSIAQYINVTDTYISAGFYGFYVTSHNSSLVTNLTSVGTSAPISLTSPRNITFRDVDIRSGAATGISISGSGSTADYATFYNVTVRDNAGYAFSISSLRNLLVYNLTTNGTGSGYAGVLINGGHNLTFIGFNSTSDHTGINFNTPSAQNNTFANVFINGSRDAGILIQGSLVKNTTFYNVTVINSNRSRRDFEIDNEANGTRLINFRAANYSFKVSPTYFGGKSVISIVNDTMGSIDFITGINATGTNLSADVWIINNTAYVNGSRSGLNVTANITLYGLSTSFANPLILKDGVTCTNCYNFTSLNAGTVVFNVTGWSNYSIGESLTVLSCQVLNQPNGVYTQGANIVPSGSITACINITAENVTFNGNGYWIANSTFVRRGVHSGQRNTTILGTNISLNSTANTAIGIMFEQSGSVSFNNSRIYNNTVTDVYYGVYFSCTSPIPRYFVELNKTFLRNNSYGWYTTCAQANVTDITVLNAGTSAFLVSGHNNSVTNFSIAHTASGGNGIQIVNARQNVFANGTMQNNSNALYVNGPSDYAEYNEFSNISIVNTSGYDYRSSSSASVTFTGNTLTDMYIQNYSIGYESTMIEALIVRTSGQGAIQFLAGVNGSGTNFTNDIRVSSNFAYVNATRNTTQTGMNRSATITFYNMPGTFTNPTILRDGVACSAPNCNNLTSLNAATVIFNVSAWSNYSIGESLSVTSCQILGQANSIYTQAANIVPWDNVTTLACINITARNVTFNGNGYSIKNTTFYADGIYSNQINTTILNTNVTVTNLANSWAGVHFVQANNSRVINSTLNAQRYGVNLEATSHTLVENVTANANADTGIVLSSSSTNNTIRGNIANSNPRGISLSGTGGNIFINNNASFNSENIRVLAPANVFSGTYASNGSSRGVSIFSSGNNNLFYNTTLESNFDSIWISANSNNSFFGGLINGSRKDAIVVGAGGNPALTTDNRFANITIVNTNSSQYDLNISTASLNKTLFTDMVIANYTLFGVGGTVIVNSSTYGYIYFTQTINGSGTNFSSEIFIRNNSAFVNSSQSGLNKTANITLYGLSTSFFSPSILRDGASCTAPNCNNFTSLNAGTVAFNVTGWSNYSIGSSFSVTSCTTLDQANTVYTQGATIVPNVHPCINITATNITFIGNGYSFANSTFNYTVIYTNQTNTTITGLNITISSTYASGTALYLNRSTNSRVTNLTVDTAYTGIFFEAVNTTLVNLATIRNTVDGVHVGVSSRDLNITNIEFYNSTDGVHVFGTGGGVTNIQMFNMTVRASSNTGLRIVSASRTVISNATVVGSSTGISIDSLSSGTNVSYVYLQDNVRGVSIAQVDPVFEHSVINGSSAYGLRLTGASDDGRFGNITFRNNNVSVSLLANTGSAARHNFSDISIVNSSNSAVVFDVTGLGSLNGINLTNVVVTGTNSSYYDAEFIASGADLQNVVFEDSYFANYSFNGSGGRFFVFSSYNIGSIKFAGVINGSGTNLTGSVRVTYNTAFVNSSIVGLNQSANITLLDAPITHHGRVIYNGVEHCPPSVCANFTSLEDGSNIRFNVPGWSNYSIGNLPPVNITLAINSTSGSNKTEQDLNCYGTLLDLEADAMNTTVYWYNSSILHYTTDRNNSYANGTFVSFSLHNANTTKGHNWSCGLRIFDGTSYRFVNTSYNLTILNTLPNVTLLSPPNANLTTDRTPVVNFSIFDADNETVTWHLNVTLNKVSPCVDSSRHYQLTTTAQSFGTNVSYEITPDLHCLYDNLDTYNWTVRANDSEGFGSWSETWKINVSSIVSITLLNNTIEFGPLAYLESNDTSDDSPRPFLLENDGTVFVNVTIVSTQLWATQTEASAYYTYKAANYTPENGSFSGSQSAVDYTLLKISPQSATMCFAYLNYTDASDTGEIDINITVPINEPPGVRRANVTLLASLAE